MVPSENVILPNVTDGEPLVGFESGVPLIYYSVSNSNLPLIYMPFPHVRQRRLLE